MDMQEYRTKFSDVECPLPVFELFSVLPSEVHRPGGVRRSWHLIRKDGPSDQLHTRYIAYKKDGGDPP